MGDQQQNVVVDNSSLPVIGANVNSMINGNQIPAPKDPNPYTAILTSSNAAVEDSQQSTAESKKTKGNSKSEEERMAK